MLGNKGSVLLIFFKTFIKKHIRVIAEKPFFTRYLHFGFHSEAPIGVFKQYFRFLAVQRLKFKCFHSEISF